jgi:hypothetical protein
MQRDTGATFVSFPENYERGLKQEPEVLRANLRAYGDDREVDRVWFKAHPKRTMYVRPATRDEGRIVPLSLAVLVIQVRPGRRYRQHLTVGRNHTKRWCKALGEQECRDLAEGVLTNKARDLIQRLAA